MSTFTMKTAMRAALVGCMIPVCFAKPGDGIHAGAWELRPFAELNGVHDSNINQTPTGPEDDMFLDSTLGLRAGRTTYALDLGVLAFLSQRTYADASDKDFGAGGELVKLKYGNRDQIALEADQSFRRVEDIDRFGAEAAVGGISPDSVLDVTARQRRDIDQAGVSFGKNLTEKTDLDVGYRFDTVNYENRDLLDLSSHGAQVESSRHLTDKTAALITLKAGLQDNDVANDPAEYYTARAGLKTHGTDKLSFKAGLGAQEFKRPDDAGSDTRFNYDLGATWTATDKLSLQAGGRNGTALSSLYADNGADYDVFWLGAAYRLLPTLGLGVNGAYRVDNYFDPVLSNETRVDREDKGKSVRVRADYLTPAKFLRVYSEATYETVTSTLDDYDETRISLGVNLQY